MNLKDFMEVCDYRITEGTDFQWQCFGSHAYQLDSWDGDIDGHTVSIIFDTHTQEFYQVLAYDYAKGRAYRLTNPKYIEQFKSETRDRDVLDLAWEKDDGTIVKYTDLETDEDFLEKARAIVNGEDYDTRIQVPINFSDDELFRIMKMAHEQDITLNQLVERALQAAIDKEKL